MAHGLKIFLKLKVVTWETCQLQTSPLANASAVSLFVLIVIGKCQSGS